MELQKKLLQIIVDEWCRQNTFILKENLVKDLTTFIKKYLAMDNLQDIKFEDNTTIIISYGSFEKTWHQRFVLSLNATNNGCSESGRTGISQG